MCEFHESTCNGLGDIWWTDNPIYFSSIDSHTRNSVTMSCNSVTEQNLLIANNQCMYYDQTFVHCVATSDTNQMLLVIGNNWQQFSDELSWNYEKKWY